MSKIFEKIVAMSDGEINGRLAAFLGSFSENIPFKGE